MSVSQSDDDGVIGYHVTTVDAGHQRPDGGRSVAFDQNETVRPLHRLDVQRVALLQVLLRVHEPGFQRFPIQGDGLRLLPKLLVQSLLHVLEIDLEETRQHAVVNHVAHEPPEPDIAD